MTGQHIYLITLHDSLVAQYQNIWIEVFRQLIMDFENGVIVKIYKS